jgi:ParB family chromosome partitioning protein
MREQMITAITKKNRVCLLFTVVSLLKIMLKYHPTRYMRDKSSLKVIVMELKQSQPSVLTVDIADIDLAPGTFCMSFHFDLERLKASIDEFGLLNPPYLLRKPERTFAVVLGYRRLLAVKNLGWKEVKCQILPGDFSPLTALLLNLNDNLIHRQLNNIEKCMVLQRLQLYLGRKEIIKDFLPLLGLPANRQTIEVCSRLEGLEEVIRVSVAMERISLRVAGLMADFERDDRLAVNDLLLSCKWSFNQQWEVLQWIREISEKEGCSIKQILGEEGIRGVLDNTRISKPQKIKRIVAHLKVRRFPSLITAHDSFRKGLTRLSLPPGVTIVPPRFFEGNIYRLELIFAGGEELKEKITALAHTSGLEKVTDFWREDEEG